MAGAYTRLYAGDLEASYRVYAQECRDKVAYADYAANITIGMQLFEQFTKVKLSDIVISDVVVRNFQPGEGEAAAKLVKKDASDLVVAKAEKFSRWVYRGGQWFDANCDAMTTK